jgi:DNA-binding HxlR family transcriptional regulator
VSQKSEPTNLGGPRACSIADALELVGERWSLLVLRELGFGVRRFKDIQVNTGAPRETLALRLRKLEEAGVIERRRYCDHPPRDDYLLTAVGRDLTPVLTALREWGERHATSARRDAPRAVRQSEADTQGASGCQPLAQARTLDDPGHG